MDLDSHPDTAAIEPRIMGLAGLSGSGKTTLVCAVLPVLVRRGILVSTLKHGHHRFDIDKPGKDSYRHREAGAHQVLIASDQRWALMTEHGKDRSPSLAELLTQFRPGVLILIEGFKQQPFPKLLVHRRAVHGLLDTDDLALFCGLRAIVSDAPQHCQSVCAEHNLALLALNDIETIADFIKQQAMPLGVFLSSVQGQES